MEIGKPEKIHEVDLEPAEAPRPFVPDKEPAREPVREDPEPVTVPEEEEELVET